MDDLHAEIMKEFIEGIREDDVLKNCKITTFADDGTPIDVHDLSLTPSQIVEQMTPEAV